MVGRRRLAGATLLLAAVLTSCSSSHPANTPATTTTTIAPSQPPAPGAGTAWGNLLGEVGKNGSVSPAMAVEAFGLAVAPLPGAPADAGTNTPVADGTLAVQWAVGKWPDLTASQRLAVQDLLAPGQLIADPTLTALAQRARSQIAASMGRDTDEQIEVVVNPGQLEKAQSLAYTAIFDDNWAFSGKPSHCVVHVNPSLLVGRQTEVESAIDHQVFHCFEADEFPTVSAYAHAPAWLLDGASEWAGDVLDPVADPWYGPYLTGVSTPLFQRTYDAVGFFAHMADTGMSPWTRVDPMLRAGSSEAAYLLGVNRDSQASWASSLARQPFGSGWQTSGPGVPPDLSYHPAIAVVRNGSNVSGQVAPYSNALVAVDIAADVVDVTVSGPYGRLHAPDGSEHDGTVLNRAEFCITSACSSCPNLASLARLPTGPAWLAVTGDVTGARYSISGSKAVCTACPVGDWTATSYSYVPPPASAGTTGVPSEALSGGSGIAVHISPAGFMAIDYAGAGALSVGGGGTGVFAGQQSGLFPVPGVNDKTGTFPVPAGRVTLSLHLDSSTPRNSAAMPVDPFGGSAPVTWACSGSGMTFAGAGPATVRWSLSRNP
jgi:hypothetical protein